MDETEKSKATVRIDRCIEFLSGEGYRPRIDGLRIAFKKEGIPYTVDFLGEAADQFSIHFVYSYDQSELDRMSALEFANEVNIGFSGVETVVMAADTKEGLTLVVFQSDCQFSSVFELVFNDVMDTIHDRAREFRYNVSCRNFFKVMKAPSV